MYTCTHITQQHTTPTNAFEEQGVRFEDWTNGSPIDRLDKYWTNRFDKYS